MRVTYVRRMGQVEHCMRHLALPTSEVILSDLVNEHRNRGRQRGTYLNTLTRDAGQKRAGNQGHASHITKNGESDLWPSFNISCHGTGIGMFLGHNVFLLWYFIRHGYQTYHSLGVPKEVYKGTYRKYAAGCQTGDGRYMDDVQLPGYCSIIHPNISSSWVWG